MAEGLIVWQFEHPDRLWLLLAVLWFCWPGLRWSPRRMIRCLAFVTAVLCLADPMAWGVKSIRFYWDQSDSLQGDDPKPWLDRIQKHSAISLDIIPFSGHIGPRGDRSQTNLEAVFAQIKPDDQALSLIWSDGHHTSGPESVLLKQVALSGPLNFLMVDSLPPPEVALVACDAPLDLPGPMRFDPKVWVSGTRPIQGKLRLQSAGAVTEKKFSLPSSGLYPVQVSGITLVPDSELRIALVLDDDGVDQISHNNHLSLAMRSSGQGRVLLLRDENSHAGLEEVLRDLWGDRLEVQVLRAWEKRGVFSGGYSAVLLQGVGPSHFAEGMVDVLSQDVASGMPLLILASPQAYALPALQQSSLGTWWPAQLGRDPSESLHVVALVDASGTMGQKDTPGGLSRLATVQKALAEVASHLNQGPRLDLVVFRDEAWQAGLQDFLQAGGSTRFAPALQKAWNLLEDSPARQHVLLLSDGQSEDPRDVELSLDWIKRYREAEIGLSVLTLKNQVAWPLFDDFKKQHPTMTLKTVDQWTDLLKDLSVEINRAGWLDQRRLTMPGLVIHQHFSLRPRPGVQVIDARDQQNLRVPLIAMSQQEEGHWVGLIPFALNAQWVEGLDREQGAALLNQILETFFEQRRPFRPTQWKIKGPLAQLAMACRDGEDLELVRPGQMALKGRLESDGSCSWSSLELPSFPESWEIWDRSRQILLRRWSVGGFQREHLHTQANQSGMRRWAQMSGGVSLQSPHQLPDLFGKHQFSLRPYLLVFLLILIAMEAAWGFRFWRHAPSDQP